MTDAERVVFLIRPDGVAAFAASLPEEADRAATIQAALAEYRDARLAAAYLLELLCAEQRVKAAQVPAIVKRVKLGQIEVEKASTTPKANVMADALCSRAQALRREHRRASTRVEFATPRQVPR